jgi:hypothetical protein
MSVKLAIAKFVDHLALPPKTKRRSRKGIARGASFARGSGPAPLLYFLSGMISYLESGYGYARSRIMFLS